MTSAVALTTYNGEKYIIEQLRSILDQDEAADEVIICDDGSTDQTITLIRKFILANHLERRWKLILNEHNLGYGNNFHKAMNLCNTDFIFLCDQDDVWRKNKISVMKSIMMENSSIKLLCTDYEPFSSSDDAPSVHRKVLKSMNDNGELVHIELSEKTIFLGRLGCLMCVRRDFLKQAEKYWYSGWPHDDYLWKTALCYSGCFILHRKLIDRRLHSGNVSMRPKHSVVRRISYLEDLLHNDQAMLKCAKAQKLSNRSISVITRNIQATELRLQMFNENRVINVLWLIPYFGCYQSKRAIVTEPLILLRNK